MIPSLEQLAERFSRLVVTNAVPSRSPLPVTTGSAPPVAVATPAAAAAGQTAAPTAPPCPVQTVDYPLKGYHLDVSISPRQVVLAAEILDQNGFALDTITGVDWIAQNEMEVVYDYFHPLSVLRVVIRTRIRRDNPEIPTISPVFPGANWHERETHDFFGIRFSGHPDLTPLLLPEDADYHPLRKDFTA
jgi:NADH-quinone oxidoreductase subunit C